MAGNVAYLKKRTEPEQPKALDVNEVRSILARNETSTLLRFSTAGSVDDGKSTLIGRLLHDSKSIYEDTLESLEKKAKAKGTAVDLSLVTDGLKAEQEQGITIDVAYRYFSTPKRRFILADTPGHEQYTRNMATGASTADLTIILIDARKGVITQTKRHSFIASLLGVPRLLVAINKMDLVDYSEKVFDLIRADYTAFASKLGIREVRFVPISALQGDNIVERSERMLWYHGETVLEYLENVYVSSDTNQVDFRYPVQYVIRPNQNYRGYAGQIRSGGIKVGEEVIVLPSMRRSKVKSIDTMGHAGKPHLLDSAHAPLSVCIALEDELDISRGDMLVRPGNMPTIQHHLEAMVVWMNETPMDPTRSYILMHTSRETKAIIDKIDYKVDVNSLSRNPGGPLSLNEIGRVGLTTKLPLFYDSYTRNRSTGNFILVDSENFLTVGAGLIIDRHSQDELTNHPSESHPKREIHREAGSITRADRETRFGAKSVTFWCTGLSGSGKSTIAKALEEKLFRDGKPVYRLDGDNLRFGLNQDLGFSKEDRAENIRRAAEVAKLFNDAGVTVICSLISPLAADREMARQIIGADSFLEIHLSTPLSTCEERDPHGLYRKARTGEIKEFTGITAPYEAPLSPTLELDTAMLSLEECIERLYSTLLELDSE